MAAHVLKISSYAELVSSIPHTLGFTPVDSMVCLCFGDGPVARIDLPEPGEVDQWVQALTDVYLVRHHPRRLALVAYGDDGARCVEALAVLADALGASRQAGGFGASGGLADRAVSLPEVGPVLWVDDDRWTDLANGAEGTVDASSRARIDAEFAVRGHLMPAAGRDDLAAAMRGDSSPIAAQLPAAQSRFAQMDTSGLEAETGWLRERLTQFCDNREYLSDADAARALTVIQHIGARDAAVTGMSRKDAPLFSELWHDLVRRAPATVRDTPATLLALSCFVEGRGAQAWVALDQLSGSNTLADLVAVALEQAVDPREWDTLLAGSLSGGSPRAASSAATPPSTALQQAALRDAAARSRANQNPSQNLSPRNPDPGKPADPDTPTPGR